MGKSWNEMNQAERTELAESMLDASFGHTAAIIAKAYLEANTEIARLDAVIERLGDENDNFISPDGKDIPWWLEEALEARIQYAKTHRGK